ncbi:MAG: hypothetical protein AAFV29_02920, partial [Myxococcota bacterium]
MFEWIDWACRALEQAPYHAEEAACARFRRFHAVGYAFDRTAAAVGRSVLLQPVDLGSPPPGRRF